MAREVAHAAELDRVGEAVDLHRPEAAADPARPLEHGDRPLRARTGESVREIRTSRPCADDCHVERRPAAHAYSLVPARRMLKRAALAAHPRHWAGLHLPPRHTSARTAAASGISWRLWMVCVHELALKKHPDVLARDQRRSATTRVSCRKSVKQHTPDRTDLESLLPPGRVPSGLRGSHHARGGGFEDAGHARPCSIPSE
jgi:hypothetical protein